MILQPQVFLENQDKVYNENSKAEKYEGYVFTN